MADEIEKFDLTKFATTVTTTKGAGYRNIYVNSSRMAVSPWDVRITIGQVIEVESGQVNQDEATLVMSPQHAKSFFQNLEKTIASYEGTFGTIPELTAAIEKAKSAARGPKPKLKRLNV